MEEQQKIRLFADFAVKLISQLDAEELAWYTAREVVQELGFDDCVIYFLDQQVGQLNQVAAIGSKNPNANRILNPLSITLGDGITGRVARDRQAMVVGDLRQHECYIPDIEPALSEICVPILSHGYLWGVIDSEAPGLDAFDAQDLEMLSFVAALMAAKLELIHKTETLKSHAERLEETVAERTLHLEQANAELERLSTIDGLTEIYNRRFFDSQIDQYWRRHMRSRTPVSLALLDVDFFKKYNDHYGHQAGDFCLQQVAAAMRRVLRRPGDLVARYGGEEFAVLLDEDADGAKRVADNLRREIEALAIEHAPSHKGVVSISVGVASTVPDAHQKIPDFIRTADQALYASKEGGRDRVTVTPTAEINEPV